MTIAFATHSVPMHGRTPWERCLGGSESAMVFAARALAARGHDVDVFTRCEAPGVYDGVTYHDVGSLGQHAQLRYWDVFVSLRFVDLLQKDIRAALRLLWCQDVLLGMPVPEWLAWCDGLVFVSEWHRQQTIAAYPGIEPCTAVVENPVDLSLIPPPQDVESDNSPTLLHLSRPERGLGPLLEAWPSIRARVPSARLQVARYRSFNEPRGSQIEAYCLSMDQAVEQTQGASHVGHLPKPQLYELMSRATLMAYPARFDETSCIAAIEAQACGTPVVAVARGALPETLSPEASVLVSPGPRMVQDFTDRVVELLYDSQRRAQLSAGGRARAARHDVAVIAQRWEALFLDRLEQRAQRRAPAIGRSLAARGDLDAAQDATAPGPSPAVAPWPGLSPALWQAVVQRLRGAERIALVGDERLVGELSARTGATVLPLRALEPLATPVHAALDMGALLAAPDRSAFLHWIAGLVPNGGPVVHLLPAAPGAPVPEQRVHPVYDDIRRWFGADTPGEGSLQQQADEADIGLSIEADIAWGQPARAWLVSYAAGQAPARPDRPARKRVFTRPVPTVSVCMIVRDAASTIVTTLDSVLPIADEIHIVDTGSTDSTLPLLVEYQRRCPVPLVLRQEPWPDDFAAARNMSIQQAGGDWILWIDADERLIGGERLRRLLQSEHYQAFAIKQHNHIFDRGATQVEIPFRVFRNGRGYRFYGAVHEHPERALNETIEPWMVAPQVDILHYGYLTEPTRRRKLLARNLRLLMLDFEKYPGRQLTDILYLRDCVNLARFGQQAHGAIRPDHRQALIWALERFEQRYLRQRCRHYHLGREYYDRGLGLLGQGHDIHVKVGGPEQPEQVHRFRHPDDAVQLAYTAAWQHVHRSQGPKPGGQP